MPLRDAKAPPTWSSASSSSWFWFATTGEDLATVDDTRAAIAELAASRGSIHDPVPALAAAPAVAERTEQVLSLSQPLSSWIAASGRVALIGDAAHPLPPNLAQGASVAVEDAASLAHALASAFGVTGELSLLLDKHERQQQQQQQQQQQEQLLQKRKLSQTADAARDVSDASARSSSDGGGAMSSAIGSDGGEVWSLARAATASEDERLRHYLSEWEERRIPRVQRCARVTTFTSALTAVPAAAEIMRFVPGSLNRLVFDAFLRESLGGANAASHSPIRPFMVTV